MTEFRIRALRGDIEETIHEVSVSTVEIAPDGTAKRSHTFGVPTGPVSLRSAAKPFQVLPLFENAIERFGITQEEVAMACASHNSEVSQVRIVRAFLDRLGLTEDSLACGSHPSLFRELGIWQRVGTVEVPPLEPPSRIANNCSGKHTAMLAVALAAHERPEGYHEASHPVQQRCRDSVCHMADLAASSIITGIDGCGVVCFGVPLAGIALAYARLAMNSEPARAVLAAMTSHPALVAGARRTCTAIMQAFPGQIAAKIGAAGVYGATFPEHRTGLALKVHDGNAPAASAALLAVCDELGLLPGARERLPDFAEPAILNTRKEIVGKYEAVGRLGE